MSKLGTIGWVDLTVKDASGLSKFYADVIGWKVQETPVEDYHDFTMCLAENDMPQAGICHKKGQNSDIPSQWLMYVYVDDIEKRTAKAEELGGTIIKGPTEPSSYGRFTIIKDPEGAVMALFQAADEA
ncbi:MAG: VOC family protein [Flavobacteriales bacterium]